MCVRNSRRAFSRARKKAHEAKSARHKADRTERSERRTRARNRLDLDASLARLRCELRARIAHKRRARARIAHEREVLALFHPRTERLDERLRRVRMKGAKRRRDAVMVEQLARATCVLGKDKARFTQRAQRAKRDVFEVADGRRDDGEFSRHRAQYHDVRGARVGRRLRKRRCSPGSSTACHRHSPSGPPFGSPRPIDTRRSYMRGHSWSVSSRLGHRTQVAA